MSSGRDIGDAHVEALQAYLSNLRGANVALSRRGDKVHLTAVAKACGFNREVLYQNPRCKAASRRSRGQLGFDRLGDEDGR
jgi:hypothetical protein